MPIAIAVATMMIVGLGRAIAAIVVPVSIGIDVGANSQMAPAPAIGCAASDRVNTAARTNWWLTFGSVQRDAGVPWKAADSAIRCGRGSFEAAKPDRHAPFMIASLTLVAAPESTRIGRDRSLSVQAVVTINKLVEWREGGQPRYMESTVRRNVFFSEGGSLLLPILLPDESERTAFKVDEVLLRIDSTLRPKTGIPHFGTLIVKAGADVGDVLLDGGFVGQASRERELTVENVGEGEHEVALRDARGRTTYRLVSVERRRTAMITMPAADAAAATVATLLSAIGKNTRGYEEFKRSTDGATVIRIPGTEFLMGNRQAEMQPFEHMVELGDYLIDRTAVTWRQFKEYAAATGASLPPDPPYWGIHDDHPAVFVSWEEAKSFCAWAGGRLPTEAERELAARGTDRRLYPWGNEPPTPHHAVFRRNWGGPATEGVGKHPAGMSPYGAMDMGGNVWEWVADWYDDKYFEVSPKFDPKGPRTGSARVVRGASWDSRPTLLSASGRNFGYRAYREGDFGFRCAMDASSPGR